MKVEEVCNKSDCRADDLGSQLQKLTVDDAAASFDGDHATTINGNHEAYEAQDLQPCEAVVEEVKQQLATCQESTLLDVEVVQEPSSTAQVTIKAFFCQLEVLMM